MPDPKSLETIHYRISKHEERLDKHSEKIDQLVELNHKQASNTVLIIDAMKRAEIDMKELVGEVVKKSYLQPVLIGVVILCMVGHEVVKEVLPMLLGIAK